MLDVLDKVETQWRTILAGRLFDDPATPSGPQVEMHINKMGLQTKRVNIGPGQDYPFTLLYVRAGEDVPGRSTFLVDVLVGFHIKPDTDGDGDVDGDDDLITPAVDAFTFLVNSLRGLAANVNAYIPYPLHGIKWQIGDENGAHPGPDNYMVGAVLTFQQEPIL